MRSHTHNGCPILFHHTQRDNRHKIPSFLFLKRDKGKKLGFLLKVKDSRAFCAGLQRFYELIDCLCFIASVL